MKKVNEIADTLNGQHAVSAVLGRSQERKAHAMAKGDDEAARKHNKTCKDAEETLLKGMDDLDKKGVDSKKVSKAQMNGLSYGRYKHDKENMKENIIKINENTLKQIVTESVKRILKEYDNNE